MGLFQMACGTERFAAQHMTGFRFNRLARVAPFPYHLEEAFFARQPWEPALALAQP
jgi:hypothetical protein